jgi:hypothetical protein
MQTAPAAVQRAQVVGVRRLVRLRRHVARAHDGLPQVVGAVHEVDVVTVGERRVGGARHEARVNARHHELYGSRLLVDGLMGYVVARRGGHCNMVSGSRDGYA